MPADLKLPAWMEKSRPLTYIKPVRAGGNRFIGKSLHNLKKALADDLAAEKWAAQDGWLQRQNPTGKLAAVLLLLLAVSLARDILIVLVMWLLTILLMLCSRLPLWSMQKRIWGVIPLLTLLIALPAALNVVVEGTPLLYLCHAGSISCFGLPAFPDIYLTRQGIFAAVMMFMRVGVSLSLGVLLVVTTPLSGLFKALRRIGISPLFIIILEMSYRYLLLLLLISVEIYEARQLRVVGNLDMPQRLKLWGSSLGALFGKSMLLCEEVYQAMSARCYNGGKQVKPALNPDPFKIEVNLPQRLPCIRTGKLSRSIYGVQ
jgi:cobalt/nickel transport system permease protein